MWSPICSSSKHKIFFFSFGLFISGRSLSKTFSYLKKGNIGSNLTYHTPKKILTVLTFMEWNCFLIGQGIKEIWAIKVVTPTSGNPVYENVILTPVPRQNGFSPPSRIMPPWPSSCALWASGHHALRGENPFCLGIRCENTPFSFHHQQKLGPNRRPNQRPKLGPILGPIQRTIRGPSLKKT